MKRIVFPLASLAVALVMSGCNSSSSSKNDDRDWEFESVPRIQTTINQDWSYLQDYASVDSTQENYDSSHWQRLSLPHAWDVEAGQNGGDYFYGESTYRKTLNISSISKEKNYYLEFEGVALISKVFVNGDLAGLHNGGFSTFRIDVTDFIKLGENQVTVQVDNRLSSMKPEIDNNFGRETFLPLDAGADFTWWGGIYRDVHFLELNNVSIDAEDFGGPGIYLSQKSVSRTKAEVELTIHIRNKSEEPFHGQVAITIRDVEDKEVKTLFLDAELEEREALVLADNFVLENPHLWNGVKDPYLYQVYVQLIEQGEVIDEVNQPLGLRSFEFKPGEGFFLNGELYPLRGVAMHQDYIDVGWATSQKQRIESLDLVKDMGANTIRFSHYPHSIDSQAYSDQLGFINWVEIPMINAVSLDASYLQSAKQQLTEMIKQHYNHPSVGVWGITNEINVANPVGPVDTANLIKQLSSYAHELDGDEYRKTVQAAVLFDPVDSPLHQAVDINSYNRYDGWYMGTTEDFGLFMDEFKQAHPDRVIGVSEYGAGVSPYWHSDTPIMADHSEQYSQFLHEGYLTQIEMRPHLWGTHIWNMFDFTAHNRDEGDTKGRNDKGMVSLDRQLKKDAYYLYQAAWSNKPMVHIASKRQMEPCPDGLNRPSDLCGPEGSTRSYVKAYSNLDALTLYINGGEHSTLTQEDNAYRVAFEWKELNLEPGQYSIEVRGEQAGIVYSDRYTLSRDLNDSNMLSSSVISVVSDDNGGGQLTHLAHQMTLAELKSVVQVPSGAILSVEGKGDSGSLVLELDDVVLVESESGDERRYVIVEADDISFARPVIDNGFKGFLGDLDNAQNLVDGIDTSLWASVSLDGSTYVEVDLQHVYYIDQVMLSQGTAYDVFPGAQDIAIGTNVVAVDHKVHVTQPGWNERSQGWDIHYEGKNVRVGLTNSEKVFDAAGQALPIPMLAQVVVSGGMIRSDVVAIDYAHRVIDVATATTVSELLSSLNTVSTEHGSFTVNVLDEHGAVADSSANLENGYCVEVLRHVQDANFREVYSLSF